MIGDLLASEDFFSLIFFHGVMKIALFSVFTFLLVADTQLYKSLCLFVRQSVRWSVCEHESRSVKTRISAPAYPSAKKYCMAVYPALFPFSLFDEDIWEFTCQIHCISMTQFRDMHLQRCDTNFVHTP